jgi:hypothetical protein
MKTLWQAHMIEANTLTKIQSQSPYGFKNKKLTEALYH